MTSRLAFTLVPIIVLAGCATSSLSSGAEDIGRGGSCQIRDSIQTNGDHEIAEVREATCETSAGFLAPDVASMFVSVRERSVPRNPSNIVLRYEVVCPDAGGCDIAPPMVKWLNRSSLQITPAIFGDIYCVQRTTIDRFTLLYSKTPLRDPPQRAFTNLQGLCE
jgi:hypothetical protein